MTVHLGPLFFFTLPLFPLHDALQTVNLPLPLSITCFTFTATVPLMCASVPANTRPLCTLCACISSLLPYVSLHRWCMLSAPFLHVYYHTPYACLCGISTG